MIEPAADLLRKVVFLPDGHGLCVREGLSFKVWCSLFAMQIRNSFLLATLKKNKHSGHKKRSFSTLRVLCLFEYIWQDPLLDN